MGVAEREASQSFDSDTRPRICGSPLKETSLWGAKLASVSAAGDSRYYPETLSFWKPGYLPCEAPNGKSLHSSSRTFYLRSSVRLRALLRQTLKVPELPFA